MTPVLNLLMCPVFPLSHQCPTSKCQPSSRLVSYSSSPALPFPRYLTRTAPRGEHRARIYGYTGPVTVPSGLEGPALRDGVRDGYPPYQAVIRPYAPMLEALVRSPKMSTVLW